LIVQTATTPPSLCDDWVESGEGRKETVKLKWVKEEEGGTTQQQHLRPR